MGVIKSYVQSKENTNLDIAKETERLYISGLNYKDALRKAKEEFGNKKAIKDTNQRCPR